MHISLIALGQKMPTWVNEGFEDYQSRLKQDIRLQLIEIPLSPRKDPNQLSAIQEKETKLVLSAIPEGAYVVTLDGKGREHSSESLAERLKTWQQQHQKMALLIGAPEGLTPALKARAAESWSLGKLTLPHPLVRIVVVEALYRAWSINHNHPYHRA
ncbi:MAG: 23S rRNA (pseudouridine(1915)-N(3))-methyltransferase RlmH [Cardiobacteriaceae bacterium]|nr:23S rRNA (pseudouridine(1915)-N(3))-methyltransferase RlmH [Cardiobacteriaceae bacterium]